MHCKQKGDYSSSFPDMQKPKNSLGISSQYQLLWLLYCQQLYICALIIFMQETKQHHSARVEPHITEDSENSVRQ